MHCHWNCFKGDIWEISEWQCGAHIYIYYRLSWALWYHLELKCPLVLMIIVITVIIIIIIIIIIIVITVKEKCPGKEPNPHSCNFGDKLAWSELSPVDTLAAVFLFIYFFIFEGLDTQPPSPWEGREYCCVKLGFEPAASQSCVYSLLNSATPPPF